MTANVHWMRKKWWVELSAPAVVLIISVLATRDLWQPGFFVSHDGIIHAMRLAHFDNALSTGQFPVRWLSTWMGGYGSPLLNYNWNLPYYVASGIHTVGASYEASLKLVLAGSLVLSGFGMYLLLHTWLKSYEAAVAGSILYVWAPYRFTDVYIRGAVGEACAFIFLPLICWMLVWKHKASSQAIITGGILWGAFILTHNIIAFVTIPLYLAYALYLDIFEKSHFKLLFVALVELFLGMGVSAWFWLPAIAESKFINYLTVFASYEQQFPSLTMLLYSPWRYAYAQPQHPAFSMSFQVGIVHWVVIAAATVITALSLLRIIPNTRSWLAHSIFYIGVYCTAVFLSSDISKPLYENVTWLKYMTFPWRFLTHATFAASILTALIVAYPRAWAKLLGIMFVAGALFLYWPYSRIVTQQYSATDSQYFQMVLANNNTLPDMEFLPKIAQSQYIKLLTDRGLAYGKTFFSLIPDTSGKVETEIQQNLTYTAQVDTFQPALIQARIFNFPGWAAFVDGSKVQIDTDIYGLISFALLPGKHEIKLIYNNTPIRVAGNLVSLVFAFMLPLFFIFSKRPIRAP